MTIKVGDRVKLYKKNPNGRLQERTGIVERIDPVSGLIDIKTSEMTGFTGLHENELEVLSECFCRHINYNRDFNRGHCSNCSKSFTKDQL